MLDYVNDISIATAKAIVERREFCALCDSKGVPTVFALAQGREFCFLSPVLRTAKALWAGWEEPDYDNTPGSMDTSIDLERSLEDDIEEFTPDSSGQANATGIHDVIVPTSPIPGAWN